MRPDLIVRADGPERYVIKDPITGQYVALPAIEFRLLTALDGATPVTQLLEQLRADPGDPQLSLEELNDLVSQFVAARLVVPVAGTALQTFVSRRTADRSRVGTVFFRLAALPRQLLSARIRLFDPSALLCRLRPFSKVVYSRSGATVWLLVCGLAVSVGILRFGRLMAEIPGPEAWFAPELLLPGALAFIVIKALHELAHATMADRWGAECREAGVLLILFTPIPYTNVTDTWMIDRRQRMLVASAGVLVELFIAAVCLLLWSTAAPGVVRTLLAGIVLLCSATTLLFNANPLVRFDGYFVLADAVDRPNLARQSATALQRAIERVFLGALPAPGSATGPNLREWASSSGLLIFGLLSAGYRMMLGITIALVILQAFRAWGLPQAGGLAALFVVAPMLAGPFAAVVGGIVAGAFQRARPGRALLRAGSIAGLLLVLFWIPLPRSIVVPAVVEPAGRACFVLQPAGLIRGAEYGARLPAGAVVAFTGSSELNHQLLLAENDVRRLTRRIELLSLQRSEPATAELPEIRKALAAAERQRDQWKSEFARLEIRAGCDGVLQPPRAVDPNPDDSEVQLPRWSGLPLSPVNEGAYLAEGTLLGILSPPAIPGRSNAGVELTLCLTADDRRELQPGQTLRFQPQGAPGLRLTGTLQNLSAVAASDVPAELVVAGLISTYTPNGKPGLRRDWRARAILPETEAGIDVPLYSTGLARIPVAPESLARRLWRNLRATFAG